jgi:hypothetical protein
MQTATIRFEDLLDDFRALGGIAENVRREIGSYGPGMFPIDRAREAVLWAPETLLIPAEDLEVRGGSLVLRAASAVGSQERQFFESLHMHAGWSTCTFDELWALQQQWRGLPDDVVAFVKGMGAIVDADFRFAEPSIGICLYQFVRSRDVSYRGNARIMPVIDIVNHSSGAPPYVMADGPGVGVRGTFPGEILVRYNVADAWATALAYSFADASPYAYSLSLMVDLFGTQRLSILRNIGVGEIHGGLHYPVKRIDGNTIELSHLMLGNARQPDLPRALFRKLMRDHIAERQADDVFESLARFNHSKFIEGLRILRKHDAPLVAVLEEAAIEQLDALSACVGARAL